MSSDAQILANRANSQLSTGPTTPEGKAKSSLNATKTGLTGRTVVLSGDDLDAYYHHTERCFKAHAPAGDNEEALVQSIADIEWRILRIPSLEMGIYAIGRLELASLFADEEPAVRASLIEAQVFLTYQKQFNNLSVQENRLRRQREKDLAALNQMKAERAETRSVRLKAAARLCLETRQQKKPFNPEEFGFDFSIDEINQQISLLPVFGDLLGSRSALLL